LRFVFEGAGLLSSPHAGESKTDLNETQKSLLAALQSIGAKAME